MAEVIIYSTMMCPFCVNAKNLLEEKGVSYQEIRVDEDQSKLSEMLSKSSGRRTVPQIFINDEPIGGSDELHALEQSGELDRLLEDD